VWKYPALFDRLIIEVTSREAPPTWTTLLPSGSMGRRKKFQAQKGHSGMEPLPLSPIRCAPFALEMFSAVYLKLIETDGNNAFLVGGASRKVTSIIN
jgi:hypothetical protein